MRRRSIYWLNGAILVLIWTAYYYAKRSTGGLVEARDRLVCGAVGLLCVGIVIRWLVQYVRTRRSER